MLSGAKFVRSYLEIFLRKRSYENHCKIKLAAFVYRDRPCHVRKVSATTNSFFVKKKNGPIKPETFDIMFDC
jgi:hypothetical protein